MNPGDLSNLEPAIKLWRRRMIAAGIQSPDILDELENHLRENVERQMNSGLDPAQAFEMSLQRLGQAADLKNEFALVPGGHDWPERIRHFIRALAVSLNPSLAVNMNTPNSHIESARVTYLKAVGFLVPAVSLWIVSCFWLFPKLNQFRMAAGVGLPGIYGAAFFVTQHWILFGGALMLALFLLERRFRQWPRYRRTFVGAGVFVLNSTVMILITIMVILALLSAQGLLSHAR